VFRISLAALVVLLLAAACFGGSRVRGAGARAFQLQVIAEALEAGDTESAKSLLAAAIDGEALIVADLLIENPEDEEAQWAAGVLERVVEARRTGRAERGPVAAAWTEAELVRAIKAVREGA
jgi:hypothetical protein